MFEFKLDKVAKMGEPSEQFGQTFWCTVEGEDLPVMFSSHNESIKDFDTITAEEKAMRKTKKGDKTYWQLRKVKVVERVTTGVFSPQAITTPTDPSTDALDGPILETLKRIESKVDSILNIVDTGTPEHIDEEMPEGFLT